MELVKIEQLLKKYLNAATTLEEEDVLKKYFTTNKVAPHLQEYVYLFEYFKQNEKVTFIKTINIEPRKVKNKNVLQIAASIVLLIGMYMGYNQYQKYQQEKQYVQITEALRLVSVNFKKANDAVANLYTYENTVHKIFNTK